MLSGYPPFSSIRNKKIEPHKKERLKVLKMSYVGIPESEYKRDGELRGIWHEILSSKEWEEKLPSSTWRGFKLEELLWKIEMKEGWEKVLIELWKELQ